MKKAVSADEAKNRTCVPAWKGLKFIFKRARHYNNALITDEQAVELLNEGLLSESDFKKLPEGYKAKGPSQPKPKGKGKGKSAAKKPAAKPAENPQPAADENPVDDSQDDAPAEDKAE